MYLMYHPLVVTVAWCLLSAYLVVNSYRIKRLAAVVPMHSVGLPSVAIIVPARNEGQKLRDALEKLAALQYTGYEVILVNDRSTDGTAHVMDAYCDRFPCFKTLHLQYLPAGWLGKCHALHEGSKLTTADWLLFADADVLLEAAALSKAVAFCTAHQLQYLTVMPELEAKSRCLDAVYTLLQVLLLLQYRPWKVQDPDAAASFGMGAFHMVRRSVYVATGGHKAIALQPNDDLQLAAQVKAAGYKAGVLYGKDIVHYAWYDSTNDFIHGLAKNAFSSVNFNYCKVALNVTGALLLFVLPLPMLLATGHYYLFSATVFAQIMLLLGQKAVVGKWWHVLLLPFSALLLCYTLLRSAWITTRKKGIRWSNEFYPLQRLKKSA